MNKIPNKFNFFVPADIEKSKNAKGEEVMKIGGIASTSSVDADGEVLDPQGFQLDYLLQNGYLNWHHQAKSDPNAIVGEPTRAEITKDGLYIEGELYRDSKVAQGIFDLAKTLESRNSKRRLGFSIEGQVIERDPIDNSKVLSAKITGVAITPTPKNPNTLMNIIKGHYNEIKEPLSEESSDANGGSTCILLKNGDKVIIDDLCNVQVVKATTTASSSAIIAESVDGNVKNQEEKLEIDKSYSTFRNLTDTKAFEYIFQVIGPDIEKAQIILNLCKNISNDNNMPTTAEIQKAMKMLGLTDDNNLLEKANDAYVDSNNNASEKSKADAEKNQEDNLENKPKSDAKSSSEANLVKKADDSEDEDEDQDDVEKAKGSTIFEKMSEVQKALSDSHEDMDDETKKACQKALTTMCKTMNVKLMGSDQNGGSEVKLSKGMDNQFQTISNQINEIQKGFDLKSAALGTLNEEVLNQVNELKKGYTRLSSRINEIESTPLPRKTQPIQYLERQFEKAQQEGKTPLSRIQNKNQITAMLDEMSGLNTSRFKPEISAACMQFEQTGEIKKSIQLELEKTYNVRIID